MTAQIYVATHKIAPFPDVEGYVPIHNGKACSEDLGLGIIGDDTQDNISSKMPVFSECCTMYWIWKNVTAEVVGLAHYRRYFAANSASMSFAGRQIASPADFAGIGELDLIVADVFDFKKDYKLTVEQQYSVSHYEKDLALMRGAIRKLRPSYLDACEKVLSEGLLTPFNLFVGKKSTFDAYCAWLFPIMFLLEDWIPWMSYPPYQRRVISFLSERLFSIWLYENGDTFRIERRPVVAFPF